MSDISDLLRADEFADWLVDIAVRVDELKQHPEFMVEIERILVRWANEYDAQGAKAISLIPPTPAVALFSALCMLCGRSPPQNTHTHTHTHTRNTSARVTQQYPPAFYVLTRTDARAADNRHTHTRTSLKLVVVSTTSLGSTQPARPRARA